VQAAHAVETGVQIRTAVAIEALVGTFPLPCMGSLMELVLRISIPLRALPAE
jgi:hypothetical protein